MSENRQMMIASIPTDALQASDFELRSSAIPEPGGSRFPRVSAWRFNWSTSNVPTTFVSRHTAKSGPQIQASGRLSPEAGVSLTSSDRGRGAIPSNTLQNCRSRAMTSRRFARIDPRHPAPLTLTPFHLRYRTQGDRQVLRGCCADRNILG